MYFPKNKIKTGLQANTGEFVYADDLSPFIGNYYSLYNGTFFEGKSPTKGNRQIIPSSKTQQTELNQEIGNKPDYVQDSEDRKIAYIVPTNQVQNVPIPSYRSPLRTDYAIGQFIRYFCKKVNESVFIEIDKSTYTSLYNKNQNWVQLYTPFQVYWLIAGDYQKVIQANKTNVLRKEQSIQVYGFSKYIEKFGGYDKFYF